MYQASQCYASLNLRSSLTAIPALYFVAVRSAVCDFLRLAVGLHHRKPKVLKSCAGTADEERIVNEHRVNATFIFLRRI
jgi:hypothetical protein